MAKSVIMAHHNKTLSSRYRTLQDRPHHSYIRLFFDSHLAQRTSYKSVVIDT